MSARFILAVQNLNSKIGGDEIQPSDIENLIETFGTSVITHVTYGGRATLIRKGSFNEAQTEAVFKDNEDDLIFQGGDTIAIHSTSEKYNTWRRTIQENPNIIGIKYISLGDFFYEYEFFNQFGISGSNMMTIQGAYYDYMYPFTASILDTTQYWSCGQDFAIYLGMKYCTSSNTASAG